MKVVKYLLVLTILFYSCNKEKKAEIKSDIKNLIVTNELKDINLASGKIITWNKTYLQLKPNVNSI